VLSATSQTAAERNGRGWLRHRCVGTCLLKPGLPQEMGADAVDGRVMAPQAIHALCAEGRVGEGMRRTIPLTPTGGAAWNIVFGRRPARSANDVEGGGGSQRQMGTRGPFE